MFASNRQVLLSGLTVVLLAAVVCFRFFGDVILHPDEFLFGSSGDGLKNYYTVAYQVIHGEGMWFNGMLYPYGDHLMFADGQPLLAKVLSWFMDADVNNGPRIVAIMNLLMIGSLIITAWCVHRLLVWNMVDPWFAVPFALTIAFLSPQLARLTGHYALGFTFFVPMLWLLIAGFSRFNRVWLFAMLTSVVVLLFAFIHPYYLFIHVLFLGTTLGWELVVQRFRLAEMKDGLAKLVALLLPLVVFIIYQKWMDPYSDRPTSPTGTLDYVASFQSVFVPVAEPFYSLFNSYFFRIFTPSNWEGQAYIGMVASFVVFSTLLLGIRNTLVRRWKSVTHPVLPSALRSVFVPAIITLLFSMGLFHVIGLQWLSEVLTPLKQFRSLGRMAWIFYYVISVWAVFRLWVLFRHFRGLKNGRYTMHISVLVGLCAFLWMLDAIVNIKSSKAEMMDRSAKEAFSDHYASQWRSAGVNSEEFQAIIPLPLMLIGSEKIDLDRGVNSFEHAMKASFSTGLPIVGGTMSRTSLLVTEKTAQLIGHVLIRRAILQDMDPKRKLLILCSNDSLSGEEQRLLAAADLVFETSEYRLYSTDPDRIAWLYGGFSAMADSMEAKGDGSYLKPRSPRCNEDLWKAECYEMKPMDHLLDSIFYDDEARVLSYWVKVDPETELLPTRAYAVDGVIIKGGGLNHRPDLLDGWLFVSEKLKVEAGKRQEYFVQKRGGVIGRIQLRRASEDIRHNEGELRFLNNIPLR